MSNHNVKVAGDFQNLIRQCLMTDCVFVLRCFVFFFSHWVNKVTVVLFSLKSDCMDFCTGDKAIIIYRFSQA